jgi:RNA polymerase sigma-70 factor (ECF subfamily)
MRVGGLSLSTLGAGGAPHLVSAEGSAEAGLGPEPTGLECRDVPFEALYDQHVAFVWRSLRRLGVKDAALDDAVQDVFLTVHRKLGEFEGRSSFKTWLFGISLRVARKHHAAAQRSSQDSLTGSWSDVPVVTPAAHAEQNEVVELFYRLLQSLHESRRMVFVLAEIEEFTVPEIAEALRLNLNTVYSRLRAARREFEQAVLRLRAQERRTE